MTREEPVPLGDIIRSWERKVVLGIVHPEEPEPLEMRMARVEFFLECRRRQREARMDSEEKKTPVDYALGDKARVQIARMLDLITKERRPCTRCGRTIWLVRSAKSGTQMPMTDDAVSHFSDCPHAASFRVRK